MEVREHTLILKIEQEEEEKSFVLSEKEKNKLPEGLRKNDRGISFDTSQKSKKISIFKIRYNKNLTILPEYVDHFVNVYNGKTFVNLKINEKMIGFKFGEFIYTRKKHIYKKKK